MLCIVYRVFYDVTVILLLLGGHVYICVSRPRRPAPHRGQAQGRPCARRASGYLRVLYSRPNACTLCSVQEKHSY